MMFWLGVVLISGLLLWRTDSRLEWSIPFKWQTSIKRWKEGLSRRTHILQYVWYLGPRGYELEKHFWQLQKELPRLREKFRVPLWIEVGVYSDVAPGQKEIYISCLQRRFPEIEIYECSFYGEGGDDSIV